MLVSYKWLQEYFEDELPEVNKLTEILTLGAFEIEGVEEVGDDHIIDVDVLHNRAHDCLSHRGIAREIATLTEVKLKHEEDLDLNKDFDTEVEVKVESDLCRRYMGCEIKNVVVKESPEELKQKLEALGQKSINNIVDITNIVMYSLGQPMHAFDADKLDGGITVRMSTGEHITTLDNKEVDLDEEVLVIADDTKPLAIAGIKGGKKAEVDENTVNIILESANFNPTKVRKTARKIGIATDSSKRFENEITPELAGKAMKLAVNLILQYASGENTEVSNIVDLYPKMWREWNTGVSKEDVSSLMGREYSDEEIKYAFDKLGFKYEHIDPREKIVEEVESLLDRPYKYGASVFFDSPNAFDCSSLVSYVYSIAGYSVPRMAIDQFIYSDRVEEGDLQPGDLVFSNTDIEEVKTDYESKEYLPGTKVEHGVDHVGIYVGDGKVIHATKHGGDKVIEENVKDSKLFGEFIVGYGRIVSTDKRYAVSIPVERLDVRDAPELIEEIARVIGYDKIELAPVEMKDFKGDINYSYVLSNVIRNTLKNEGYSEIISYTFVNEGGVEPLKPIAEDKGYVRGSLVGGMQSAFERNINNADLLGLDHVKMFEIGKVFNLDGENVKEDLMLCIGVVNKVKKPKVEDILNEGISKLEEILDIKLNVEVKNDIVEINLDEILTDEVKSKLDSLDSKLEINTDVDFRPISPYPFMLRDIAVWVPSSVEREEIVKLIKDRAGELLVNIKCFDVYEKDDMTSYAHRLVFQSEFKTLTDEEANLVMDEITKEMEGNDWEVR